jgi:hypothetical protein
MSPRTAAYATALARVAAGAAFVGRPAAGDRAVDGCGHRRRHARGAGHGPRLGVRELALGAGMVDALRRGGSVRPWSWLSR